MRLGSNTYKIENFNVSTVVKFKSFAPTFAEYDVAIFQLQSLIEELKRQKSTGPSFWSTSIR